MKSAYPTSASSLIAASVFLIALSISSLAQAAACCGGGFAAPSLIAGDEKAQFSASYSMNEVTVDSVDDQGIWRSWDDPQTFQILRLEAAHIFQDRWQVGGGLPFFERHLQGDRASGPGDTTLTLGYEYLPDWNYNPYRPKGLGFLQLVLPTGKSRAESENLGLDTRGNGFWAVGAGTLLTKIVGRGDGVAHFEAHRSFGKEVRTSILDGRLEPGYGGSVMLGAGYSLGDWRLGSAVTWVYEDPIRIERSTGADAGQVERYATASLSASYLQSAEWAGTVSYTDQTLFGSPINTSLGRGIVVQIQRRWAR